VLGYLLNRVFVTLEKKALKWRRGLVLREAI